MYVTIIAMPQIREYVDKDGRSTFGRWFDGLDAAAAARVTTALTRLGEGNFSNVKPVGEGVAEYKIDFGPGYRIYFRTGRSRAGDPAGGRNQEAAGRR